MGCDIHMHIEAPPPTTQPWTSEHELVFDGDLIIGGIKFQFQFKPRVLVTATGDRTVKVKQ